MFSVPPCLRGRSGLQLGAGGDDRLDELVGNGAHLVAHFIAGDLAGPDGDLVLDEILMTVLALA